MRSANDAAPAVEQDNEHDLGMSLIGIGSEPTEAASHIFIIAGASLAELLLVRVVTLFCGAIQNCGEHSLAQIGEQRSDVELLPKARFKILLLFRRARILQI